VTIAALRRSPQQPGRIFPVGAPQRNYVPTATLIPEVSLERLIPLVDYLAAGQQLPNVSPWVLRTIIVFSSACVRRRSMGLL
jgi:hypothetical protein